MRHFYFLFLLLSNSGLTTHSNLKSKRKKTRKNSGKEKCAVETNKNILFTRHTYYTFDSIQFNSVNMSFVCASEKKKHAKNVSESEKRRMLCHIIHF